MPITKFPVTLNVSELGIDDATSVEVSVSVNTDDGTINYPSDNYVFSSGAVREFAGGTGSFELPGRTGANPANFEFRIDVLVHRHGSPHLTTRFAPRYLPAPTAATAVAFASLAGTSSVPASWMTSATLALQAKVDEANAAADRAAAISDIDTPDALVGTLVATPGSSTATALSAAIGARRRAAGGTTTTGAVMFFGDHAYAVNGIATAAVFGGATNNENVIGGNLANVNTTTSNLTGAPTSLAAPNGNWNFLNGGYDNVVNGWACVVSGFHQKVAVGANHITINGGSIHAVGADAAYGTIAGGTGHTLSASSSGATIGGGRTNTAGAQDAVVGGGQLNEATGNQSTVSGGFKSKATAQSATVGGGLESRAKGISSTVGGGQVNAANGVGATVPGGREGIAHADYSLATGRGGIATHPGEHAHGGGNRFSYTGDVSTSVLTLHQGTVNATAADMWTAASAPPVIPELTTWTVSAVVTARRADAVGENASWRVEFLVKRDAGSTTALVGTPTVTPIGTPHATWTVSANVYSLGNVRIIVTGEAAKTIRWVARVETVQVQSTPTAAWAASTAYTVGQKYVDTGKVMQAVAAGTSATTAPVAPAIAGDTVTDGGVTWLRIH